MKKIGYTFITLGFLAGALISVLDELTVQWGYFVAAFVWSGIGIGLVRLTDRRHSRSEGTMASNIQTLETSLFGIVESMKKLNSEKESTHVYDIHLRIDERLPKDLTAFADARETIVHVHGLQAYADVMSSFAAGERYLNRAWSASTDGYIDEVHTYLEKSQEQFEAALQLMQDMKAARTS